MSMIAAIIGRLLLAIMFIVSGLQKIVDPGATMQALQATNLPGALAAPLGIFEVVAGAFLGVGLMTRVAAILLAAFAALSIFFFHNDFTDPVQGPQALLNLGIIGGLLMVFAYGQMRGSYDHMRASRKVHEAELRAARAEAKLEGATAATAATTTVVRDHRV